MPTGIEISSTPKQETRQSAVRIYVARLFSNKPKSSCHLLYNTQIDVGHRASSSWPRTSAYLFYIYLRIRNAQTIICKASCDHDRFVMTVVGCYIRRFWCFSYNIFNTSSPRALQSSFFFLFPLRRPHSPASPPQLRFSRWDVSWM